MENRQHCNNFASLLALFILILLPLMSCKEETYKSLSEIKPECCVVEDPELKRFNDIDYDSFVSLMGRRSAEQPNRHMDHKLMDLLGKKKKNPLSMCHRMSTDKTSHQPHEAKISTQPAVEFEVLRNLLEHPISLFLTAAVSVKCITDARAP